MSQELLYFNGINGATGTYGLRPMTGQALADHITGDVDAMPDNLAELKEKLKNDALDKIFDINKTLLSKDNAKALEEDAASRAAWLETLVRKLAAAPVDSINNSISKGIVAKQVNKLIEHLKEANQTAIVNAPESARFNSLIQELETLANLPQQKPAYKLSWGDLVQTLGNWLRASFAGSSGPWSSLLATLNKWLGLLASEVGHLGVKEGVDPNDLAQAGWGIIFGAKNPLAPKIKEALAPLLNLRQSQAGPRFKVYEGGEGYRDKDTARTFMARRGIAPTDPVDPDKAPFYLLIVGSPEEIPFSFAHQLDVQFAVGRIDFGQDMAAYACYARSVVKAEKEDFKLAPQAAFFGVANSDDKATSLSVDHLVRPLYESLQARYTDWQMEPILKDDAKKARLLRLMGGDETPALLFTASHGMEFPQDDPKQRQLAHQGALLCQDWPGPNAWRGEIPHDFYLAGDDLTADANLLGTIAFFFACFGGGTPLYDEFSKLAFRQNREIIAEHPFVAALPKAMLSLSRGGALAVIAHVERAWGTSFLGPKETEQITVFESALERLLKGQRVGFAMDYFNARYAALSAELAQQLEEIDYGLKYDPYELAGLWTANNDARGYVIIGDPAVRLKVATPGQAIAARPAIESAPITTQATAPKKPYTEQEWQQTPPAVQAYIKQLEAKQKSA
jgi:hypothetical protein